VTTSLEPGAGDVGKKLQISMSQLKSTRLDNSLASLLAFLKIRREGALKGDGK
jgi:hypothetical protein